MGKLKRVLLNGDASASSLGDTEKIETRSTANDFEFFGCSGSERVCNGEDCVRGAELFGGACRITLDGGGVKGDFALVGAAEPPTRVAYALLDMGGNDSGIISCGCCVCLPERLNSQKRALLVLVVLEGGVIRSMGLVFDRYAL